MYKMLISHVMYLKRLMNVTSKRSQLFYILGMSELYISIHREPTYYWVYRTTQRVDYMYVSENSEYIMHII